MRTILLTVLLSAALAGAALAQPGPGKSAPKKKKPAMPDTTRVERAAPDSTSRPTPPPDTIRAPEKPAPSAPVKEPTVATPPRQAPPAAPGFSNFVPRAVLCAAIEKREPAGVLDSVVTAVDTVYFFTEIAGLEGNTITHRWKYDGEIRAEIPMAIGGPHWRVYSRKVMHPEWTGEWVVEVVDADTRVLVRHPFAYRPASRARP